MRRFTAFLLLMFFASCGDEGIPKSKIRSINASPDSAAIDVFDGESVLFDAVPYGEGTEYAKLDAESHDLKITLDDSFTTFFDSSKGLKDDTDYTLILYDFTDNATATLLRDENDTPSSGQAKIRIIHAAPSLEDVDLYITAADESFDSETATVEDIRFREVSSYLQSVAGDYRIRVTEQGTKTVIADSDILSIDDSRIYTILLLDRADGGEPFAISVITDK